VFLEELPQADGGGETGRPSADDQNVDVERLPARLLRFDLHAASIIWKEGARA
jgi:hypothetical protein